MLQPFRLEFLIIDRVYFFLSEIASVRLVKVESEITEGIYKTQATFLGEQQNGMEALHELHGGVVADLTFLTQVKVEVLDVGDGDFFHRNIR